MAKTEIEQDRCAADLEDAFTASEVDKAVALSNILRAVDRIELRLVPCRWWDVQCRRHEKDLMQKD